PLGSHGGRLLVQGAHLSGRLLEARVRELAALDQLERLAPELRVGLAELALELDVLDALLRLRRGLLGRSLRLVQEPHSRLLWDRPGPMLVPERGLGRQRSQRCSCPSSSRHPRGCSMRHLIRRPSMTSTVGIASIRKRLARSGLLSTGTRTTSKVSWLRRRCST